MKRVFAILVGVWAVLAMQAATYGILLNGQTFIEGQPAGEFDGYQQYLANVQVKSGDYCQLYDADNQAAWAVDLDQYSEDGFTRNGDKYDVSVDGCYAFYIKLKFGQDLLYIGHGSGCYDPSTVEYYIAGEGLPDVSWAEHKKLTDKTITFSDLKKGTYKFKITSGDWSGLVWGYDKVDASCSSKGYTKDNDGNVMIAFASDGGSITVTVGDNKICVTIQGDVQMIYGSAVPEECTDVLMQAFFYDSYNDNAPGADLVGNTRWATLLPQAAEIGKYIDLIWLPPSANGDGTGYHPKQYSNQNSNWGTRAELEKLIAAFHDAGAKVIADIVINHCTGWTSWCDFPEMDFGEYGVFHPDASYICKNDEVNLNPDAGDCYGKATGNYDDGENWDGARDWAHDNVYVQDFFKAYLQWMRNVMKYDGFRYDKGDGFNNWHHDNYNKASGPYIAFMECYSGDDRIIAGIEGANRNLMALDFQTRWDAICGISGFNYSKCAGSGLLGKGYAKYAVTFIDSHDWFMRDDNGNEFGGHGNSLTPDLKDRLLQANAYILGMPGVPCIFYPHWYKYKEELKPMIEARKFAGVHSQSNVYDESAEDGGYQCTLQGKYGWMVLQLGNKTNHDGWGDPAYKLMAKGPGYAMWVNRTAPIPTDVSNQQSAISGQKAEKFIQDGQLFIRLGENTYDIMGNLVR